MSEERMRILQMIEDGRIGAAEAERLIRELGKEPVVLPPPADPEPQAKSEKADAPPAGGPPPEALNWKRFWAIPFALAVTGVMAGAWLIWLGIRAAPQGSIFWLLVGLAVFWVSVALTALAFASRKSPWVHVRVKTGEKSWPQHIAISLPVPLRPAAWAIRVFGHHIPDLKHTAVDEILTALDQGQGLDQPLYIDMDEGDGERVQVYFG